LSYGVSVLISVALNSINAYFNYLLNTGVNLDQVYLAHTILYELKPSVVSEKYLMTVGLTEPKLCICDKLAIMDKKITKVAKTINIDFFTTALNDMQKQVGVNFIDEIDSESDPHYHVVYYSEFDNNNGTAKKAIQKAFSMSHFSY
jgi:hypothetical protein